MKRGERIIGINSLFLIPGKVGGTEVFFRKQIEELSKIKTDNKYIIYANEENKNIYGHLPRNFKIVNTGVKSTNRFIRILWEQFILPIWLYRDKVDLLHSPGYTTPIITHCKKITTIFDLNYHFHPEDFSLVQRLVFSILIPLGAYASNKIIVHSNQAKKEMVKILKVPNDKVEVIYGGVPEDFKRPVSQTTAVRVVRSYGVTEPFILANASSHPHKNLKSLLLAFVKLTENKKFNLNLVLLGIHGKAHSELDIIVKDSGIQDRVRFTGWIDHNDTKYFNKVAEIFVMPSLYEGFGLPTAEAMACGTPVVASKYSCTPEIVGNGGLVVDVKKPEVIANSIKYLLSHEKVRNDLSKLGRKRAEIFSWKELGQKIYNLYNV